MSIPSAPAFNTVQYHQTVWRVVEAQHIIATSRLTQNIDDQRLLEALVEQVKPAMPALVRHWPYLLQTPFRYGHKTASRFRSADERPGIFYASEHVSTALAETGYWRLRFFAHLLPADWPTNASQHHSFYVDVRSPRTIDLTVPPYATDAARWTQSDDYTDCQQLARGARAAHVHIIRYQSVRDPEARCNIALLAPEPLQGQTPVLDQSWSIQIEPGRMMAHAGFPNQTRYDFRYDMRR
jgi:hypothetical protein